MRSQLRNLVIGLALGAAGVLVGAQSITIPNTFVNGTTADATQVNANFTALSANALNRAAGIFSGTATPASDNTIDLGSGALRFANVYGTQFRGGGANLTALAAANITAGGVLPALNGSALTTLNATNVSSGTLAAPRLPTGSVVQVVFASYSTETDRTSSVYGDTGLTATITPTSASNKILVVVSQQGIQCRSSSTTLFLKLVRGASDLMVFGSASSETAAQDSGSAGGTWLDSPATTSATTYKTQFKSQDNVNTVRVQDNADVSTITLMEIVG